jgi:cytochrome c2
MLGRNTLLQCLFLAIAALLAVTPLRAQDNPDLKRGKSVFASKGCGVCHAIGKKLAGPDLAGVTARRSNEWLTRWLKETDVMLETDSTAMALLKDYKGLKMPKQPLTDQDVAAVIAYIDSESNKKK